MKALSVWAAPYFEVNSALLSRAAVYVLQPLSEADLDQLIQRAQALGAVQELEDAARQRLLAYADGAARRLLNTLETLAVTAEAPGGPRRSPGAPSSRRCTSPRDCR